MISYIGLVIISLILLYLLPYQCNPNCYLSWILIWKLVLAVPSQPFWMKAKETSNRVGIIYTKTVILFNLLKTEFFKKYSWLEVSLWIKTQKNLPLDSNLIIKENCRSMLDILPPHWDSLQTYNVIKLLEMILSRNYFLWIDKFEIVIN